MLAMTMTPMAPTMITTMTRATMAMTMTGDGEDDDDDDGDGDDGCDDASTARMMTTMTTIMISFLLRGRLVQQQSRAPPDAKH